jgi:osmotically-inducible protein OsmY
MTNLPKSVTVEGRKYEVTTEQGQVRLNGGKSRKWIYLPAGTTFDGHDDFRAKCVRTVKEWEQQQERADANFQQYLAENNVVKFRNPVSA